MVACQTSRILFISGMASTIFKINVAPLTVSNATVSTTILKYRKTSSISRTKSQSLNVSCILAQLSSLNPLKPGVKLRTKM